MASSRTKPVKAPPPVLYGKDFARLWDKNWAFFDYDLWPFIRRVVRAKAPVGRDWLDVCCGTGVLAHLAGEEGYRVTGVDRSPHQLAIAAERAPEATWICGDARQLALGRRFDVVTCLFDSLNHLTDERDLARALRRCAAHLKPCGLFIFDVLTAEGFQTVWRGADVLRDDGSIVVIEAQFDALDQTGRCHVTGFIRQRSLWRRFDEEHVERAYRRDTVEGLLRRAGLSFECHDAYSFEIGRAHV